MSRAAVGFKPRTGRAVQVTLAGAGRDVRLVARAEVPLLPPGAWAPYHAAEGLEPRAAHASVERSIATARAMSVEAVRDVQRLSAAAGHELCGCGVLIGTGLPSWTTEEILAVHVRMHKAEGELFREVLVDAARACGVPLTTLPCKTPLDAAAQRLGMTRAVLDARIAALGRSAGPPWDAHHKEAAAAALVALARNGAAV